MHLLGPRIKALREEAKLNKAALARRVGVSDVTISYWESGAIRGAPRAPGRSGAALGARSPACWRVTGSNRAAPLTCGDTTAPVAIAHAGRIDLPFELVPELEWEGDCFPVTPAL